MISYLHGVLKEINDDSTVIIDVGGVGYEVAVTSGTLGQISRNSSDVELYTYLQVKEDGFSLFGFASKADMQIFKQIIQVSGIGPKGALSILSCMNREQFILAIISEDASAISKAPGIGKKMAAKICLELKDKYTLEDTFGGSVDNSSIAKAVLSQEADEGKALINDAVSALCALGYSSSESLKAVRAIEITPDMTVDKLLKLALKNII